MISLGLATELKEAGLRWEPALHDFFAVPFSGLDQRRFIIGDMLAYVEIVQGRPAVTFHGALEWALDYVFLPEVVWLPTEGQLREQLELRLVGVPDAVLHLRTTLDGYHCEVRRGETIVEAEAFGASDAYGRALLALLRED